MGEDAKAKEAAWKAEAESIDYRDLARTPDLFIGRKVCYTGKIDQVKQSNESLGFWVLIAAGEPGGRENPLYVLYKPGKEDSQIAAGRIIRFWGEMKGLITFGSVSGKSVTVPRIAARYLEVLA